MHLPYTEAYKSSNQFYKTVLRQENYDTSVEHLATA
jgi:hypothetical protein